MDIKGGTEMSMKLRRILLGIFAFLIIVILEGTVPVGGVHAASTNNLATNPGFEVGTADPEAWAKTMWDTTNAAEFIWETGGGHSGSRYVSINNRKLNHAYYSQTINVKPDTTYRLSCWIKTDGIPSDQKGAGIGVQDLILSYSTGLSNTNGKWQYHEIYGKTGPGQNQVTILLMLGEYGFLNSGKASFDDFCFQEVIEVPAGASVNDLYKAEPAAAQTDNSTATTADDSSTDTGQKNYLTPSNTQNEAVYNEKTQNYIFIALVVLAIYIFVAAYYFFMKPKTGRRRNKLPRSRGKSREKPKRFTKTVMPETEDNPQKYLKYFLAVIGISLFIRLVIAPLYKGYHFDYGMFMSWTEAGANNLWSIYYSGQAYVDYPPVYLGILAIIGVINRFFGFAVNSGMYILMLKLPAIICDIATGWILFKVAKEYLDSRKALIIATLYLFNPMIWFDTLIWGQVDSFFFLTIIAVFWFIMEGKMGMAVFMMTVSILTKPQGILFLPVLFYELFQTKSIMVMVKAFFISLATFTVITLPFTIGNPDFFWFYHLLGRMLGGWEFASVNAFNFFALVGGNWIEIGKPFMFLTYEIWGDIFLVIIIAFSGYLYWKSRSPYTFVFAALILDMGIFNMVCWMHERYLYPAILITLFIYIFTRERKALILYLGTTITNFLNIFISFIVVATGDPKDPLYATLCWISSKNGLVWMTSLLNVLLLIYAVKFTIDYLLREKSESYIRNEVSF
jgi:Gpi18-like mannosyltransferase